MYLKIRLSLITVLILAACMPQGSATSEASDDAGLRLYVFDCGWATTIEQSHLFSLGDEYAGQLIELPIRCYLIKHPIARRSSRSATDAG